MSTPIENNTEELQTILQTVNNLPNLGGSGSSDVFVVHVTLDENWANIVAADKTYEEIEEALNSGKICVAENNGLAFWLDSYDSEYGVLSFCYRTNEYNAYLVFASGEYPFTQFEYNYPYAVEIGAIPDNGSVVSGSVSDLTAFFYSVDYNSMIRLAFIPANSETSEPIAYYSTVVNLVFSETPTSAGYFARASVKEGYIDVSFTETEDGIRYEASFKRMA